MRVVISSFLILCFVAVVYSQPIGLEDINSKEVSAPKTESSTGEEVVEPLAPSYQGMRIMMIIDKLLLSQLLCFSCYQNV